MFYSITRFSFPVRRIRQTKPTIPAVREELDRLSMVESEVIFVYPSTNGNHINVIHVHVIGEVNPSYDILMDCLYIC